MIKQRVVLNDISPDFKRDNRTQEEYIAAKKSQTVDFIKRYLKSSGARGVVLGVSGGVDSFLCASLCAQACEEEGKQMYIVLLPNGVQSDFADAQECAQKIMENSPGVMCDTVSIAGGYEGAVSDLAGAQGFHRDAYTLGNLQPRLRMMYQYALAKGMLVAGTDHATEAITGFYTKYGDGGSDFNPLQELVKDDIYAMSKTYGAPKAVMEKQPAAGLGISQTDEEELGIRYADICAYLKGNVIAKVPMEKLEAAYDRSMHKRSMAASLKDEYTKKTQVTRIHIGNVGDGRVLKSTICDINAHPEQNVLYVTGEPLHEAFYNEIKKTVNTPVARYNVFQPKGESGVNSAFGDLLDNAADHVVVSGEVGETLQRIMLSLMNSRREVVLLKDCLTKVKK